MDLASDLGEWLVLAYLRCSLVVWLFTFSLGAIASDKTLPKPEEVLKGLKAFYQKTAKANGFFTPGIDPQYLGMSDCAYSDLAAVTYACTVHRTFGWTLPYEKQTIQWLQSRQRKDGTFFNVGGTVDAKSPQGRIYNTTQGLVALRALGAKPLYNPLAIFEEIAKGEHKTLPPYSTSFFPLAYLCYGKPIPEKVDLAIRATMVQDNQGYLNSHIAATYHASHYYQLVGEPTPKSREMVERTLKEQNRNGSWLLNMPSRDRHATFDAVFVLHHEGPERKDCQQAIQRAARWALSCRNPDGGFGHFPGSTSDADAIYFHIGTLVMAGYLPPAKPLPPDAHLLSWGHLMPVVPPVSGKIVRRYPASEWVGGVAFDGQDLLIGAGEEVARAPGDGGAISRRYKGHTDRIASVAVSPQGDTFATGAYDHQAILWKEKSTKPWQLLKGHQGAVLSVAYSPKGDLLATGSIDRTIKLWSVANGKEVTTLSGHRSWVNAVAFHPNGKRLFSASSDGTVKCWDLKRGSVVWSNQATKAEVRSLAISADGRFIAAGIRYGMVKVWTAQGEEKLIFQGHNGDVWAMAFSPDGKTLATGNGDWNRPGRIKLWRLNGSLKGHLQHTGEVLSLAFSNDGAQLAAGGGDKTVTVFQLRK